MIFLIIGVAIFCTIVVVMAWRGLDETCPRMLLGYNCKGGSCDHSEEAVQKARAAQYGR